MLLRGWESKFTIRRGLSGQTIRTISAGAGCGFTSGMQAKSFGEEFIGAAAVAMIVNHLK